MKGKPFFETTRGLSVFALFLFVHTHRTLFLKQTGRLFLLHFKQKQKKGEVGVTHCVKVPHVRDSLFCTTFSKPPFCCTRSHSQLGRGAASGRNRTKGASRMACFPLSPC